MKKTPADKARNMVGDEKLPNRFFVSISNDYGQTKDGCIDWIGDLIKDFKSFGGTVEMYNDYEEAKEAARGYFGAKQTDGEGNLFHVNRATVEDRLSGQVFEISKVLNPETAEMWTDECEDYYRFTQWRNERGKK